jgi:zinc transport system permease protein
MADISLFSALAGIFVGLAAGYVGSLMVLKRMALVGDALTHVALLGLALGTVLGFNPFIGAFAILFVSAFVTSYLEKKTRLSAETIVGALFTLSLSVGILLMPQVELLEALFGNITNVTIMDAAIVAVLSVAVVAIARAVYRDNILSVISEELAASVKVNVSRSNLIYLLLISLVVAMGIKFVGTLSVGFLLIVPAAAARNISPNLSRYTIWSCIFGILSAFLGIIWSGYTSIPAGPAMVIVGIAIFLSTLIIKMVSKK